MTAQWAAELGIPEDAAKKLANWKVAVLTRTEERFVSELCGAGMGKEDATEAWDKLQERQNGTCAALCFTWRARLWQSHSPDPSCSPLAVSSLFSCVSFVSLFSVTGRVAFVAMRLFRRTSWLSVGLFFGPASWSMSFLALMSRQRGSRRSQPPARPAARQARPSCRCQRRPPPVRRSVAVAFFFWFFRLGPTKLSLYLAHMALLIPVHRSHRAFGSYLLIIGLR